MDGQRVADGLVALAPVALDGVREHINASACSHLRRHGVGQLRVDNGRRRIEALGYDGRFFAVRVVGEDGNARYLAARARRCRDGDERQMCLRQRHAGAVVFADGILGERYARSGLGAVHRAAAAECHHKTDVLAADHLRARIDLGNVRVGRNLTERSHDHALRFADDLFSQSAAEEERPGDQQAARKPELFCDGLDLPEAAFAEMDLDRL